METQDIRYNDMPSKLAQSFISLVSELVEEVIGMVAERNPVFSEYKVKMSGSTREKARVGNPYELDFLIAYEIDIEEVIEYPGDLLGFVRVVPHGEERSKLKEALDSEQQTNGIRQVTIHFPLRAIQDSS